MSDTAPTTWERLAERRHKGPDGELLRDWWVVLVWHRGLGSWVAQLVSPDGVVLRDTCSRAKKQPSRSPQDAYLRAIGRWTSTVGVLPAWVSARSARLVGWSGPVGPVGFLDQHGAWTGAKKAAVAAGRPR